MSTHPNPHDTSSADPTATTRQPSTADAGEGLKYCAGVLLELVEMGRDLARLVIDEVQSQTAPGATPAQQATRAFESVTRSIRRTVMLYEKLGQAKRAHPNRSAVRKRIIRAVEDAIEHNADPEAQQSLHAEFLERLDSPDFEEEIAERPAADIVTDLCRDLGLAVAPDGTNAWKRRIPHDIAVLNARAEQPPGAPPSEKLLALLATAPPRPAPPPDFADEIARMDTPSILKELRRAGRL